VLTHLEALVHIGRNKEFKGLGKEGKRHQLPRRLEKIKL
jgi:hypothetical protein